MDSIPLSEHLSTSTLNGTSNFTRTTSDNSMTIDNESNENATMTRKNRRAIRSLRPGSTYIKNYRLSRYNNALYSTLPFRRQNVSNEELPVDAVGCFSNSTFMWVRRFRVPITKIPKGQLPTVASIEEPTVLPKVTYTDSCNVNAKRLLGMYKYEEQTNGRINSSMFKVAWNFCQTRLIVASIIRTLSILLGIISITVFLNIILHAKLSQSDNERKQNIFAPLGLESVRGNETLEAEFRKNDGNIRQELHKQIYYCIGFVFCVAGMFYLKSVSNWLDLRTAIRLRTACVSAAFAKSLNSSVLYKIASHQIISLSCDESELICNMIMKGTNLISHIFGIIFCFIAAAVVLGAPGIWPLFGILGLFLGAMILSKISVVFNRRSLTYLGKKLSIVEDYCNSFSNATFLNLHDTFRKRFSHAISCQYLALFRAETFRPNFTGGITTAILLGGLYLIWCDVDINTDKIPVLILVLLYAFIVQFLVAEWCDSFDAVLQGKVVLEKVKNSITLSPPKPSKSKPGKDLKISITDASFEWEQPQNSSETIGVGIKPKFTLKIDELHIPKNQLIGITGAPGSGKSSLIYALLGHMSNKTGNFLQKGTTSFFPQKPYTIDGSVKDNITFYEEFHSLKYYNAISLAQLNNDILCSYPGYDDVPIDYLELNAQQLQKISLARAIFCERDTVVLEEPLSAFSNDMEVSDIFQSVTEKLLEMGKTVIVVSQNDSILRHCQKIYVLVDGQTSGYCEYDEIQKLASYQDMLHNYRLQRDTTLESNIDVNSSSRASQSFTNASTEELVESDRNTGTNSRPRLVTCCETFFLTFLHLLSTVAYVFLLFTFVVFNVKDDHCMPWLATIIFGIMIWLLLTNMLIKHFLYKLARRSNKKLQRKIFEKLLNTSLSYINDTKISDILNVFMDNNLAAFQSRSTTIHCWLMAIVSGIAVGLAFLGWMAVFVIGCYLDFFIKYYYYRATIAHFANLEDQSRRKLLQHVSSQLKGRAVIQSFDKIEESRNRIYNIIEQNSTSVFLRKSTVFYTQFLFNCWQTLNLILLLSIYIFYPSSNIYGYIIVLFGFFTITSNLCQLLEVRFDKVIADRKLENAQRFLEGILTIGLTSDEPAKKENGGIPICFNAVTVRSKGKVALRIKKLNIDKGQTIGIRGKGSHLFAELILRKIEATSGALFLADREIASYSNSYLSKNIGVVPHNPLIHGATISSLLQAGHDFPYNSITSALQRFNLQAKLMKLDEPLSNLSQVERQLLCLAKCWLTMPAILIIDKPLPEIQSVIDESIRGYFKNSTVIVIGSDDSQFMHCCDKMINFSENF